MEKKYIWIIMGVVVVAVVAYFAFMNSGGISFSPSDKISITITEGVLSSFTLRGITYNVSIAYIDADKVALTVDPIAVDTNKLSEGDSLNILKAQKLNVRISDINYDARDTGISKATVVITAK